MMKHKTSYADMSGETTAPHRSPWLEAFSREFASAESAVLAERRSKTFRFSVRAGNSGLWIIAEWSSGGKIAFCAAYSPEGGCVVDMEREEQKRLEFRARCPIGEYNVIVESNTGRKPWLHWKSTLTPAHDLHIPFWPRDTYPIDEHGNPINTRGTVHATQNGPKGGLLYFSFAQPESGSLLYVQNLTALNDYCEKTHTTPSDVVGGEWPELGFTLPTTNGSPLPGGSRTVLSDAFVRFSNNIPKNEQHAARLFLDLYADIFLLIPKPEAMHRDWARRIGETIRDLTHSPDCSVHINGHRYMLPYVGADDRPPESMVQLAILVPMVEYVQVTRETIPLVEELKESLPTFFDPKLGTIVRWLPGQERLLAGKEEHMGRTVMDSWYLHYSYLNLSRLAMQGDRNARKLFLDSLPYGIKVAQHFQYRWPVFYDLKTLETLKSETKPGEGGEHDVGAQYVHLMVQAYDLTGNRYYLDEAENAAKALQGLGFRLGYQFNNTSFGAGGLLRLWRETGKELYRELSYVCLANIFRNVWLWECRYGHAKHYHTFMGVAPLQDAVYLAMYEELEILAAFHEYLLIAGDDILPSLRILLCEYCKYLIDRAWYHYPSEIPEELLAEKSKSGHLNRYLSIPLEDIYDGWHSAGEVGQEVYGAAAPFVFFTRHMRKIEGVNMVPHCDYPITDVRIRKDRNNPMKRGEFSFRILGDRRCRAMVRLLPDNYEAIPEATLFVRNDNGLHPVKGVLSRLGYLEYKVPGNAEVVLQWQTHAPKKNRGDTGTTANRAHAPQNGEEKNRKRSFEQSSTRQKKARGGT